eukprot:TRINITY_DN4387_c0_g1_i1.p1 TRINITY_DN4387_c0_g1~~TRINITY_DN4387_c0_g1_i1.p1  ORF type:complete len:541 (-),score=72.74 TRINITY_DN4387_c0_g1_i1:35-1657(-)
MTTDLLQMFGVSKNCYKCVGQQLWDKHSPTDNINLDSSHPFDFYYHLRSGHTSNATFRFGGQGKYAMLIEINDNKYEVRIVTMKPPTNALLPLGTSIVACVGIAIIWIIIVIIRRTRSQKISVTFGEYQWAGESSKKSYRIHSLDTLRGIALFLMIFVNYGGGGYWYFNYSIWNGLTVADVVFPMFIWIMGFAMALKFIRLMQFGTKGIIILNVLKRSIILFVLGLLLNNGHNLDTWRIPGVLQRISLTYAITSIIILCIPSFGKSYKSRVIINEDEPISTPRPETSSSPFRDVFPFWIQWVLVLSILAAHILVSFLLHVPGCGSGYLGAGGIGDGGSFENCTGGASGYIDNLVFTKEHMDGNPTTKQLYQTTTAYDPYGVLGTLSSIFLCFLGVQCGRIHLLYTTDKERYIRWLIWGVICGGVGLLLCKCKKDEGWIPLNRNLWSPSFVLVSAGICFISFILLYVVIESLTFWNGSPFRFLGVNSIMIYCGHIILKGYFPFSFHTQYSHAGLMLSNFIGVACWFIIAFVAYRKELVFSV